jgi:hypothetical protein
MQEIFLNPCEPYPLDPGEGLLEVQVWRAVGLVLEFDSPVESKTEVMMDVDLIAMRYRSSRHN